MVMTGRALQLKQDPNGQAVVALLADSLQSLAGKACGGLDDWGTVANNCCEGDGGKHDPACSSDSGDSTTGGNGKAVMEHAGERGGEGNCCVCTPGQTGKSRCDWCKPEICAMP